MGRPWTKCDDRLIVKYRRMGMYWDEVGELLERTALAVKQRFRALGQRDGRFWTDEQIATAKAMHGKATAVAIAAAVGKSASGVQQLFRRLDMPRLTNQFDRVKLDAFIRARHAQQWSDREIARGWTAKHPDQPLDRRYVVELRGKLGLPSWGITSARCRRRVAATTREQLRKAGLGSLAELRGQAFLAFAERQGWPGVKMPRLVQILNLLYEHGPHTREAIAKAIGVSWSASARHPASRRGLSGNGPGGSYMATLQRMGLVVRLGRNVRTGRGKGQAVNLYAIAPGVVRGPIQQQARKESA